MNKFLQRAPLFVEVILNGLFILIYTLKSMGHLPSFIPLELARSYLQHWVWFIPFIILMSVIFNFILSDNVEDYFRKYTFSLVVFIPLIISWGDLEFSFLLSSAHLMSSLISWYGPDDSHYDLLENNNQGLEQDLENDQFLPPVGPNQGMLLKDIIAKLKLSPTQTVALSFLVIIFLGAFLLVLPVSIAEGKNISFVDALFMSTSATCVTGLSTISVIDDLSLFGQLVLVALMQVGGLGIMTLSASMTIFLGRSFEMRDRVAMQDVLDVSSVSELYKVIVDIVRFTFFIELWGMVILTIGFIFDGFDFGKALYYGFFHSISAFCNAGLALFNDNFESYAANPLIHGTIAGLITLGGIGFVVINEVKDSFIYKRSFVRLSMHTKTVLITSFFLTTSGAIFIFFSEYLYSLDTFSLWEKIQVSFFQSVTLRTAGFNTIPLGNLHNYTILVMIVYMFIGASPGGTGGGIKTTTLAVLFQSIKATFRGISKVTLFNRQISTDTVVKVTTLTFVSLAVINFSTFVMMIIESKQTLLALAFEVTSAFGTVGLSLGITPYLSSAGKLMISLVMFIGRIGPLTMLLALASRERSGRIQFPEGRIMIG